MVYVTKADMCSSLNAIKDSLDAAPEVENLRCSIDSKCLNLDCNFNFFIGVVVPSRMKINLKPCASTPAVNVKGWVRRTRVLAGMYRQNSNTITSFKHLGITTRVTVTVSEEIYGVIFRVSLLQVTHHSYRSTNFLTLFVLYIEAHHGTCCIGACVFNTNKVRKLVLLYE